MSGEPVRIFEVGPRDGLQNETRTITTDQKVRLIDLLSETGLSRIEAASFVSPKWVPQMADSADVMAGITRKPGVRYAALTPNMRGYEAARAAGADEVAVFAAASEEFSQRNINCSIAESLERFTPVLAQAASDGMPVRGYLSCAIACPYEGRVEPAVVADLTAVLLKMGCTEISLGDTIGAGTPKSVASLLSVVLTMAPADRLAGHFHDTGGKALANIETALDLGLRAFDSSIAGLGGCPYAPGAPGNVATGPVAALLHERGFETGIDLARLAEAERFLAGIGLGH